MEESHSPLSELRASRSSPRGSIRAGKWSHLTGHLHPKHQLILSREAEAFALWRQQKLGRKKYQEDLLFQPGAVQVNSV